jgi:hypothetical protein
MKSELKAVKALELLKPDGGWVIYGDDFDSIIYDEGVSPITKKQFEDALKVVEQTFIIEVETKAAARQVILDRLGLTAEEAQLLLGGN